MTYTNNVVTPCRCYRYSPRKTVFYSVQYKNGWLAASDLFYMFTQSVKFYMFHCHVLKMYSLKMYSCLENMILQTDSKNEWLLLSASFTAKLELAFVLTLENAFFRDFILRAYIGLLKNGTRDFSK